MEIIMKEQFKAFLSEELKKLVTPEEKEILFSSKPEDVSNNFEQYYRKNRLTSNLSRKGVGSSRLYFKLKQPENINIDGHNTHVETGMKLAYLGSMDDDNIKSGLEQNEMESRESLSPYHILQKQPDGSFKTNKDGIILPVLSHHPSHVWSHVLHVEPLSAVNKLEHYTKTPEFPNGIQHEDLDDLLYHNRSRNVSDHPFVKKLLRFSREQGVSTNDMTPANIGIWTHPITKEKYPVILDHGLKSLTHK